MNIAGYDYTLKSAPSQEDGGMDDLGRLHLGKQIIIVDTDTHTQQQETTVVHEIFEALNFHYELKLPHNQISILETGWYQVLKSLGMDTSLLTKELRDGV